MKKSIYTITFLLSLFTVALCSCNKDKDDDASGDSQGVSATYKLEMNDNIVAEGTSTNKVMMLDNTINMGGTGSYFVITITNVPESIGGVVAIGSGDKSNLSFQGKNMLESGTDEIYWAKNGTVTRTSTTKISFEGTCRAGHSFSGSVESDVYKVK